ncbi:MAG: CHASE2 domain-containing protein [Candidatus Rokuibacteriota bacterium]
MDGSSAQIPRRAAEFSTVWRPRASLRMLVQCVLLSLIGLPLLHFHGISLHLTPWSQAIVNAIVGQVYGTAGQHDTTVVLFREENLATLGDPYPVPYARHADVLDALSAYGPRAVFVDFAFIDQRGGPETERLRRAICDLYDKGRVPVFLAAPPPPPPPSKGDTSRRVAGPPRDVIKALRDCAKVVDARMDTERGVSGVLTYPAVCPPDQCPGTEPRATPAFAMYGARANGSAAEPGTHPTKAMEIIWANRSPSLKEKSLNEKWMDCKRPGAFQDLELMIRENPLAAKEPCPYTNTISVMHLLGPFDHDVEKHVAGKAVFYGGSFQMAGDRVISPVYEDLPGVYLHAMAYDNLVTFGPDFKLADHHPFSRITNVILLVFIVFLLLVVDKPLAPATRLLGRVGGVAGRLKRIAVGLAVVSLTVTVLARPPAPALFLLPALVLGMLSFLHLVAVYGGSLSSSQKGTAPAGFIVKCLLGLGLIVLGVLAFLAVDSRYGIGSALLFVVLPGYFAYKVLVARDWLFVVTTALLVGAALVSYLPPINLGPRNIVGYLALFELARHLIKRADRIGETYLELRREYRKPEQWGMLAALVPIADRILTFFVRSDEKETDEKEMIDEATKHVAAA